MPAIPHARQMEEVFESLTKKSVAVSPQVELQPQWRLVERDGSTSSVAGPPPLPKKQECPDCLAGRCGLNARGCRCSGDARPVTISLDRLNESQSLGNLPAASRSAATNAAMPQAKPQLFKASSRPSPAASFIESASAGRKLFLTAVSNPSKGDSNPGPRARPLECDETSRDLPPLTTAASDDPGDELQRVIDRWPRLSYSARQAILILAGISNEADSA